MKTNDKQNDVSRQSQHIIYNYKQFLVFLTNRGSSVFSNNARTAIDVSQVSYFLTVTALIAVAYTVAMFLLTTL